MTTLIVFLVSLMVGWREEDYPEIPLERQYAGSIAWDAIQVAREKDWLELPPEESAAVVLAIASYESSFRKDIDKGKTRGDGGISVCLGQVQIIPLKKREKVATDRKLCFREMFKRIRKSWDTCSHLTPENRLSGYTVGYPCVNSPSSRKYMSRATKAAAKTASYFQIQRELEQQRELDLPSRSVY